MGLHAIESAPGIRSKAKFNFKQFSVLLPFSHKCPSLVFLPRKCSHPANLCLVCQKYEIAIIRNLNHVLIRIQVTISWAAEELDKCRIMAGYPWENTEHSIRDQLGAVNARFEENADQ